MRWLKIAGSLASLALLVGCGQEVVIDAPPTAEPYAGSLASPSPITDDPDVFARGGPATPALDCASLPSNGGSPDIVTSADSPTEAMEKWIEGDGSSFGGLPTHGYRVERKDPDRVLFSLDVHNSSKVAVIVRDDVVDDESESGWAVESWAMCDPAEFPAALTEEMGIPIWTETDGRRVDTRLVSSHQGAEHCEWEDITFLTLGEPLDVRQFVRDTEGVLDLSGSFRASATLPANATDTTWQYDGQHLWLSSDELTAYLVSIDDPAQVESWPRAVEPIYCA